MEIIKATKEVTKTITETVEVNAGLTLNAQEARILTVMSGFEYSIPERLFSDKAIAAAFKKAGVSPLGLTKFLIKLPYETEFETAEAPTATKRVPKVGDRVHVVRKIEKQDGWRNSWTYGMSAYVNNGEAYTVRLVNELGARLHEDTGNFGWPSDALEIVS